jgi:CSLREA domain-containing protein
MNASLVQLSSSLDFGRVTARPGARSRLSLFVSLGLSLGLLSCLFGAMRAVEAAPAAVITVNTTADELIPDGDCSLREAIQAANTNTTVDALRGGQRRGYHQSAGRNVHTGTAGRE